MNYLSTSWHKETSGAERELDQNMLKCDPPAVPWVQIPSGMPNHFNDLEQRGRLLALAKRNRHARHIVTHAFNAGAGGYEPLIPSGASRVLIYSLMRSASFPAVSGIRTWSACEEASYVDFRGFSELESLASAVADGQP